jgi:hypothetical protein
MENGCLPNRDPETNIRYGIISLNDIGGDSLDCFEPVYYYGCPECGVEFADDEIPDWEEACLSCGYSPGFEDEWSSYEPIAWIFEDDDYSLQLDEHNDVWIYRSPHTTIKWDHCSPCAPGAAHLGSWDGVDKGKAYCLGPEWFDDE